MTAALPYPVCGGHYALGSRLGGGRQAETFLATDLRTGNRVVVKRFALERAESWKSFELAEREAAVLRQIDHALLPRYLDHFEQGAALYTVMTYVEGHNLATLRRQGYRFGEAEVVALLHDAAEAFAYLHGRLPPIIHRDLKPSNIIWCNDGRFSITGSEPEHLPHQGLAIDVRRALSDRIHPGLVRVLELLLEPNPEQRPEALTPLLSDLPLQVGPGGALQRRASVTRTNTPNHRAVLWRLSIMLTPFIIFGIASGAQDLVLMGLCLAGVASVLLPFAQRHAVAGKAHRLPGRRP